MDKMCYIVKDRKSEDEKMKFYESDNEIVKYIA